MTARPSENRNSPVMARLTEREKELLEQLAAKHRRSMSMQIAAMIEDVARLEGVKSRRGKP